MTKTRFTKHVFGTFSSTTVGSPHTLQRRKTERKSSMAEMVPMCHLKGIGTGRGSGATNMRWRQTMSAQRVAAVSGMKMAKLCGGRQRCSRKMTTTTAFSERSSRASISKLQLINQNTMQQHLDSRCFFAIGSQHLWCRVPTVPNTQNTSRIQILS